MDLEHYYIGKRSERFPLTDDVIRRWERDRDLIDYDVIWYRNIHICSEDDWFRMSNGDLSLDILWDYLGRTYEENDLKWV